MNDIMTISNIPCYEKDGVAYLNLEAVARGLGFTRTAESGNEVVRWERVDKYLSELGSMPTSGHDDFIPENFYRLAMKAKNETAEKFQAKVADVIPSIRKHGAYMTPATLEAAILNPDTIIKIATALKEEQGKRKALEVANSALTVDNAIMKPKADYFDELVSQVFSAFGTAASGRSPLAGTSVCANRHRWPCAYPAPRTSRWFQKASPHLDRGVWLQGKNSFHPAS